MGMMRAIPDALPSHSKIILSMIRARLPSELRRSSTTSRTTTRKDHTEFHHYTSGRWIRDERDKASSRYTKFNIDALKKAALSATDAHVVLNMKKIAEGGFNKIFALELDTGDEVIARIPMPLSNPPHIITASEVATMEYVRERLGIPTPRVLAWCSESSKTDVQSEYIIMEKAKGVELYKIWDTLEEQQKLYVVAEWVKIEQRLMTPISGGLGGIFYRKDVPQEQSLDLFTDGVKEDDFVVGPDVDRGFWEREKKTMDIDRGPWNDNMGFIHATVAREQSWIRCFANAEDQRSFFRIPLFSPQEHISLLEKYRTVAQYLPPTDAELCRPVLWHPDISDANIFLDEEKLARGEIKISCVIDWQSAPIRALYYIASPPKFARYHSPHLLPEGEKLVNRPKTLDGMDEAEKQLILKDWSQGNMYKAYMALTKGLNPSFHRALKLTNDRYSVAPVLFSGKTWTDQKYALLAKLLLEISDHWERITRSNLPCPLRFSESERKKIEEDATAWQAAQDGLDKVNSALTCEPDGWVHPEDYNDTVKLNEALKAQYMDLGETDEERETLRREWPY